MTLSDFDYNLPQELIAQYPPKVRGESRLLVLHRDAGNIEIKKYTDVIDYLQSGDVLVLNNTRVFPARLYGKVEGNNAVNRIVEVFILEKHPGITSFTESNWEDNSRICLIRNPKKIDVGSRLSFDNELKANISRKNEDGTFQIAFYIGNSNSLAGVDLNERLRSLGEVPYPPYIKRKQEKLDYKRYQTIFAKHEGSVAAPTASLNLTKSMLKKIELKGVKIAYITLHVGYGTFKPIKSESFEEHKMHSEWFSLDKHNAGIINDVKNSGKSVWAVGTTVTRTLEFISRKITVDLTRSNAGNIREYVREMSGEADIFIYPGQSFKVVDHLLTNFHAPKTTVLLLAAAFMGYDGMLKDGQRITKGMKLLHKSYNKAIQEDFKFLSYGDSMLIF